jgi:hypothetical protein
MSRYRSLLTEELNVYIPEQTTSNIIQRTEDNTVVSPANPVPLRIPSILSQGTSGPGGRTGFSISQDKQIKRTTSLYGPASRGYASLRFYGNGVY